MSITRFLKAMVGLAPVAAALTPGSVGRAIDRIDAKYDALIEAEHQLHADIEVARASRLDEIEALRADVRQLWDHQTRLTPRPS